MNRILILMGIFSFTSVSLAFAQSSNIYTFPGPDVDLGQSYLGRVVSGGHYIGGRGDTIYVLRQYGDTYCHKSTDGGRTFGPGVLVNSAPGAVNASLRVDTAGIVYVAYQASADIYFTKSIDGGQAFALGVKVNDDTVSQIGQEWPAISVNNKGQIFIAWRDQRNNPPPSARNLFTSASFDSGRSFTPNVQANEVGTYVNGAIDITADDSARVYAIYQGYTSDGKYGVVTCTSVDSGEHFIRHTLASDLPFGAGPSFAEDPSIASSNNQLVGAAWWDGRYDSVTLRFSVSENNGQDFSPSIIVDPSGYPQFPSLLWNNGLFYMVWRATHRRIPSGPDLDHMWFSYSRDSGKTFVPFVDAVPDDTNFVAHFSPTIWVNEKEKAFVAWTDARWDPVFEEDHHLFVSAGMPPITKGDLDFDGHISMRDVVLEMNAIFLGEFFPAPSHRADGNCDGRLSAADMALLLMRWYLDIPFPC